MPKRKWKPPTNKKKADWALKAVRYYARLAGEPREPLETKMVDLLTDMMHLAGRKRVRMYMVIGQAYEHYAAERKKKR